MPFPISEHPNVKQVISSVFVIVAGLALLAAPAAAQVSAGLNELNVKGYFETGKFAEDEEGATHFQLDGLYGRFLTDRFEIGPGVSLSKTEGQSAQGAVNVFADYHLGDPSSRLVPYLEGAAGQFFGGDDKPRYIAVGPGFKWFFGEGGGALTGTAFYRRMFFDADFHGGATGANEFGLAIGVSVFFGR
jgi:hypothetical protein